MWCAKLDGAPPGSLECVRDLRGRQAKVANTPVIQLSQRVSIPSALSPCTKYLPKCLEHLLPEREGAPHRSGCLGKQDEGRWRIEPAHEIFGATDPFGSPQRLGGIGSSSQQILDGPLE